jgi:hypothetical protein
MISMKANHATCICVKEECGHPNGEPCGNPVEHPDMSNLVDRNGQNVGDAFLLGVCDECLDRAGIRRVVRPPNE